MKIHRRALYRGLRAAIETNRALARIRKFYDGLQEEAEAEQVRRYGKALAKEMQRTLSQRTWLIHWLVDFGVLDAKGRLGDSGYTHDRLHRAVKEITEFTKTVPRTWREVGRCWAMCERLGKTMEELRDQIALGTLDEVFPVLLSVQKEVRDTVPGARAEVGHFEALLDLSELAFGEIINSLDDPDLGPSLSERRRTAYRRTPGTASGSHFNDETPPFGPRKRSPFRPPPPKPE